MDINGWLASMMFVHTSARWPGANPVPRVGAVAGCPGYQPNSMPQFWRPQSVVWLNMYGLGPASLPLSRGTCYTGSADLIPCARNLLSQPFESLRSPAWAKPHDSEMTSTSHRALVHFKRRAVAKQWLQLKTSPVWTSQFNWDVETRYR